MEAHIWMTGRVGSDVDYKAITDKFSVASFRMACTPRIQRDGEWRDDETTWVSVRCARSLAEGVKCSLSKGDPVVVAGKLRTHTWVDADGVEHEQLRIDASTVGHDLAHGTSRFRRLTRPVDSGDAAHAGQAAPECAPDTSEEDAAVLDAVGV